MELTRRRLLVGVGLGCLAPGPLQAQSASEREHQPRIEAPILAEDATAVPVQVSVDHPMEPDHHIKSIEVALDKDPVPYKGKFFFTPANGRAWVAFPMRSGGRAPSGDRGVHPSWTLHRDAGPSGGRRRLHDRT